MKRCAIKRVSSKRSKQLREYARLRKIHLEQHPFCEATIKLKGLDEAEVIANDGRYFDGLVPPSTEIHHRARRYGSRLNDTSKWLAVCRGIHVRIETNPSWARENGLLDNY
jgi:hypothetical protein